MTFIGLFRDSNNLTSWRFINNDSVFAPLRWYTEGKYAGLFPLPSFEQLQSIFKLLCHNDMVMVFRI